MDSSNSSINVEVVVFEDYKIEEYIQQNIVLGKYILPLGKPRIKNLGYKEIKSALNDFINIKEDKDAIKFAKNYGLLNGFKVWLAFGGGKIIKDDKDTQCFNGGFSEWFLLERFLKMRITTDWYMGVAILLPTKEIVFKVTTCPFREINLLKICRENKISDYSCFKFYKKICKENPAQGSYFKLIGEFFCETKNTHVSNAISGKVSWNWLETIKNFKKMANLLSEFRKYGKEETLDKYEEEILGKTFSHNTKLQYTIEALTPKPIIKTSLKLDSLLDAFSWLVYSNGLVKICPVCGRLFFPENDKAVYCSDNCRVKAYYHRKKKQKAINNP
jgi:hypothetical protein